MSSHGGGGDRWLVSYSDFITLLMVLFVVLYSMGQTDVKKYKRMAESFKVAFSGGSASQIVDPSINRASGIGGDESGSPAPIVIEGLPSAPSDGVEVAGKLTNMLSQANLSGDVSVQNSVEGVLISLSQKILFKSGTAELEQDAYKVLDDVSAMLQPLTNEIRIVGYTDNTAPTDPKYSNNWELSFQRAYKVAAYLDSKGVSMNRMVPSGRGDSSPTYANDTPEHQSLNNRVDIVVMYKIESKDAIDVGIPTGE